MQNRGKLHSVVSIEGKTKVIWQLPPSSSLPTSGKPLDSPCFITSDGADWHLQARTSQSYIQLYLARFYPNKRLKEFKVLASFRILREGMATEVERTTKVLVYRPPAISSRGFDEAISLENKTAATHFIELVVNPMGNGEESRRETGYVGLCNEGNTCYINALLQTLYHLPCLRQAVFHTSTESTLAYELQKVFYDLMHVPQSVSAKGLIHSLQLDTHHRQEDVQEFSLAFCEKLKACMQDSSESGFISDLFEGATETVFRCTNVEFTSAPRIEEFIDLQLPVADLQDVDSSLRAIMREKLTGEEQFDAGALGKQDAIREVRFRRLPPVLQLFLKRFQYKYGEISKLNERFEFPEVLDLSLYLAEPGEALYRLFGVLVHKGVSYQGHYFAFLKVGMADWYRFNDNSVDIVTAEQVFVSSYGGSLPDIRFTVDGVEEDLRETDTSAYMLYYVKEGEEGRVFTPQVTVPAELLSKLEGNRSPAYDPLLYGNSSPELYISSPRKPIPTFKAPYLTTAVLSGWKGPGIYTCPENALIPNELQPAYMELEGNCTHSDLCIRLRRLNPRTEVRVWLFYPTLSRWQFRALKPDTLLVQVVGDGKLAQLLCLETSDNRDIVTSGPLPERTDSPDTLLDDCDSIPVSLPINQPGKILVFLKVYTCEWGQGSMVLQCAANINHDMVSVDSLRMFFYSFMPAWASKPASCFRVYLERCQESTSQGEDDCVLVETQMLSKRKSPGAVIVANGDALIGEMKEEDVDYVPADIFLKKLIYYTSVKFAPYKGEEKLAIYLEEIASKMGKRADFDREVSKSAKLSDLLELLTAHYRQALPSLVSSSIGIYAYDPKVRKIARLPHPTNLADPGNNPALKSLYTDRAVLYALDKPDRRDSEPSDLSLSVFYIQRSQAWDPKPLRREMPRSACIKELKLVINEEVSEMWKCESDQQCLMLELYEHDLETKAYKRKLGAHVPVATLEQALLSVKVVITEEKQDIERRVKERVDIVVFSTSLKQYLHPKYIMLPGKSTCRELLIAVKSLFSENEVEAVESLVLKPTRELRGPIIGESTVYLAAFPASEAQLQVSIR